MICAARSGEMSRVPGAKPDKPSAQRRPPSLIGPGGAERPAPLGAAGLHGSSGARRGAICAAQLGVAGARRRCGRGGSGAWREQGGAAVVALGAARAARHSSASPGLGGAAVALGAGRAARRSGAGLHRSARRGLHGTARPWPGLGGAAGWLRSAGRGSAALRGGSDRLAGARRRCGVAPIGWPGLGGAAGGAAVALGAGRALRRDGAGLHRSARRCGRRGGAWRRGAATTGVASARVRPRLSGQPRRPRRG
jgi:hypothetical protein